MKVNPAVLHEAGIPADTFSHLNAMRVSLRAGIDHVMAARISLGNMTGVTLAVSRLYPGSEAAHALGVGGTGGALVTVLFGQRGTSYAFATGDFFSASYVGEKLPLGHGTHMASTCDATALAFILAYLLDGEAGPTCLCTRHSSAAIGAAGRNE